METREEHWEALDAGHKMPTKSFTERDRNQKYWLLLYSVEGCGPLPAHISELSDRRVSARLLGWKPRRKRNVESVGDQEEQRPRR